MAQDNVFKKGFLPNIFVMGTHNAVADGEIVHDLPSRVFYVNSENDLDLIEDSEPGTFAVQYGFVHMWQLKPDGDWEEI